MEGSRKEFKESLTFPKNNELNKKWFQIPRIQNLPEKRQRS